MTGSTRNKNNVIFGRFVDYVKNSDCFSAMDMEETTASCTTTLQSDSYAAEGSKTRLCQ